MNQALETRERIISFVKINGPVLPFQIAKEINTNIIMASAHLSELVASSILRISHIKVGGSPLYYAQGQEHLLQKYISSVNEKERRAYELLKEKKILKDSELEPLTRVALRELRDFAVPINANVNSKAYIFWRWYLTPKDEAESIISSMLEPPAKKEPQPALQEAEPQVQQAGIPDIAPGIVLKKDERRRETQTAIETGGSIAQSFKSEVRIQKQDIKDDFYSLLMDFFEKNKINVKSSDIIKKNSEIDFMLEIPSAFGSLAYYCKSKNKKRISDSDLSTAYLKGQFRKLPALFLSKGELSKKAAEMMANELKGMTFKKI